MSEYGYALEADSKSYHVQGSNEWMLLDWAFLFVISEFDYPKIFLFLHVRQVQGTSHANQIQILLLGICILSTIQ